MPFYENCLSISYQGKTGLTQIQRVADVGTFPGHRCVFDLCERYF